MLGSTIVAHPERAALVQGGQLLDRGRTMTPDGLPPHPCRNSLHLIALIRPVRKQNTVPRAL
jgi:hypothetical protein